MTEVPSSVATVDCNKSANLRDQESPEFHYLGVVKIVGILLKDHVVPQMRRVRQSGTEFLRRQLGSGRWQRLAIFRLDLPVGTVDTPL